MKKLIVLFYLTLLSGIIYAQPGTWSEQNSGVTTNLTSVWCAYNSTAWVCGYSGTVLRTSNAGVNWINISGNGIPANVNLVSISGLNSDAIVAGYLGTDTWVWKTSNAGLNWQQVFYQAGGFINSVWMNSVTNCFMYGDPVGGRWSLWKSTNSGMNWDSTGMYLPQAGGETGYNNAMVIQDSKIWFGTNNSRIYYSINDGTNWTVQSILPNTDAYVIWFSPMAMTGQGLYGNDNLYQTTNNGANWSLLPSLSTGQFSGITSLPLIVNNQLLVQPVWYVRSTNLIYYSSNYGANWSIDYTNPTSLITYKHMSIANYGNGIWAVGTNGKITYHTPLVGINKIETEIPSAYSLSQNYPNPFNPVTKIRFDIQKSEFRSQNSEVTLKIYDALGREVETLVNEQLAPGTYEVRFDGSKLNSGVYFYILSTGDFSETKRMLLLK